MNGHKVCFAVIGASPVENNLATGVRKTLHE